MTERIFKSLGRILVMRIYQKACLMIKKCESRKQLSQWNFNLLDGSASEIVAQRVNPQVCRTADLP